MSNKDMLDCMKRVAEVAAAKAEAVGEQGGDKRLYSIWGVSNRMALMLAENVPAARSMKLHAAINLDHVLMRNMGGTICTCKPNAEHNLDWEYDRWVKVWGGYSPEGIWVSEGRETVTLDHVGQRGFKMKWPIRENEISGN